MPARVGNVGMQSNKGCRQLEHFLVCAKVAKDRHNDPVPCDESRWPSFRTVGGCLGRYAVAGKGDGRSETFQFGWRLSRL